MNGLLFEVLFTIILNDVAASFQPFNRNIK